MEENKRVKELPTLGTYISELRPGSACVCCGVPLGCTDADDVPGSMAEWPRSQVATHRLVCPNCGCEIDSVSMDKAVSTTGRTLNRAA